jgi:hypothetical protein
MAVPNIFANATATILLSELDTNFATPITLGNTAMYLGNTVTTVNNLTLGNATVSNSTVSNSTVSNSTISNPTFAANTTFSNVTLSNVAVINSTVGNTYCTDISFSNDISINGVKVGEGPGTSAYGSTRCGVGALFANVTGTNNTAIGAQALSGNEFGDGSVAVGFDALRQNEGSYNVAIGYRALRESQSGNSNVAIGTFALYVSETGYDNSAVGQSSLGSITTGFRNTAIGYNSGGSLTTGSNNTVIGYNSNAAAVSSSNSITLGNSAIAALRCQVTTITSLSDRRDKTNIVDIPAGLSFIQSLKPVSFDWNMRDGGKVGITEFGFIAQDLQDAQNENGVIVPNLVSEENPDKLEASAGTLIPVLVKAIQELKAELDLLKSKVES